MTLCRVSTTTVTVEKCVRAREDRNRHNQHESDDDMVEKDEKGQRARALGVGWQGHVNKLALSLLRHPEMPTAP